MNAQDYVSNPSTGKDSIGVPGEFKCIKEIWRHAQFGWKKLTQPVIDLARNGFKVTNKLAAALRQLDLENDIKANDYMTEMYIKDGKLVDVGDIIYNKRLANVIERIKEDYDVYGGQTSRSIQEVSGLSHGDLSGYQVKRDDITKTSYNDFMLLTAALPSNGMIVKYVVDLMHSLSLKAEDFQKTEFFTSLLQASELGYKMSAYTADPIDQDWLDLYNKAME